MKIIFRFIFLLAFFSNSLFCKPSKVKQITPIGANEVPQWALEAMLGSKSNVKKLLKIKDSDVIKIHLVSNTDVNELEKEADFLFIEEFQELFTEGAYIESAFSDKEKKIMKIIQFGSENASVCIKSSYTNDEFRQLLQTPSGDYIVTDSSISNFSLPQRGYLWLMLSFYEAHPELTETLRKVAGFKWYNNNKKIYEYIAVYSFDAALFTKELESKDYKDSHFIDELERQYIFNRKD